ncbi:uncharacterized protein TRIVIDRAFT_67941 [Trichoderma virens Gv29-8]|uniref:Uncharacterized protein n=1 Tax=Hypocrea virens (strain Gv29-8 / FGSC 10586) TaxID=413071 RepID=G9N196_HYPVG|nr:uncharacterized protein TRIVIDRAFT_67941 [Trichoderma virens Gv29-8]EHK19527.1 hypothetical protein TRIVIDRAFT_67941 [Trichoderma virens Gv29-8]
MNPAATPDSTILDEYCDQETDMDFDNKISMTYNDCRSVSMALDPLRNADLKKSVYKFLLEFLEDPQKHCAWAEAAKELRRLKQCSIQQIIRVLTTSLELAQGDEIKIQSLLKQRTWNDVPLFTWLPQSVCRSIGYKVQDIDHNTFQNLEEINYEISRLVNDMMREELGLRPSQRLDPEPDLTDAMQLADKFLDRISVFLRHNRVIEGQIEYLKWTEKSVIKVLVFMKVANVISIHLSSPELIWHLQLAELRPPWGFNPQKGTIAEINSRIVHGEDGGEQLEAPANRIDRLSFTEKDPRDRHGLLHTNLPDCLKKKTQSLMTKTKQQFEATSMVDLWQFIQLIYKSPTLVPNGRLRVIDIPQCPEQRTARGIIFTAHSRYEEDANNASRSLSKEQLTQFSSQGDAVAYAPGVEDFSIIDDEQAESALDDGDVPMAKGTLPHTTKCRPTRSRMTYGIWLSRTNAILSRQNYRRKQTRATARPK